MKGIRRFFLASLLWLAAGTAYADQLWISRIMTICSIPVAKPAVLENLLLAEDFTRATIPLDAKTTDELALIELLSMWQPARLKTGSPPAEWEELQSAFAQYVRSYLKRLTEAGNTLLIHSETGAILFLRSVPKPANVIICMLGVPRSLAVASWNFPRLSWPQQPDVFAVTSTSTDLKTSRFELQETIVNFDPADVGKRFDRTFGTAAIFFTMMSVPDWALAGEAL